jgi:hypothetical protein
MKPLSFDAIFSALVVLSVGAGCSKQAESVAPAPETNAPATRATVAPAATAPPPPAVIDPAPVAAPVEGRKQATKGSSAAVDAGVEKTPPSKDKRGPSASCGASGCSPDMKKGGK